MILKNDAELATFNRRTANALNNHRRRARLAKRDLDFHIYGLRQLVSRADHCPYCYLALTAGNFVIDHKEPTALSNDFGFGNLDVVCEGCNQAKNVIGHKEFHALMAVVRTWPALMQKDLMSRLRMGARMQGGGR
jgi:hypothetical protein